MQHVASQSLTMDQWHQWVRNQEREEISISQMPDPVFQKLVTVLDEIWKNHPSKELAATAKDFFQNYGKQFSIYELNDFVPPICLHLLHKTIFSLPPEREVMYDKDYSMGFVEDLRPIVFKQLNRLLWDETSAWCSIAKRLGCPQAKSPAHFLQMWIKKNPLATLKRLYVECENLNLFKVCNYLRKIPLEGEVKETLTTWMPYLEVTRYDLDLLEGLGDGVYWHWIGIAEKSLGLDYTTTHFLQKCTQKEARELCWETGRISLEDFLLKLMQFPQLQSAVEKFKEISPYPTNPGGITYREITYLAVHLQCSERKHQEEEVNINFLEKMVQRRYLNLYRFLLLEWQNPPGNALPLKPFVYGVASKLQKISPQASRNLIEIYQDLKPLRSPSKFHCF